MTPTKRIIPIFFNNSNIRRWWFTIGFNVPIKTMNLLPLASGTGLTVGELKKHIANWPETNAAGEPTEVWLETGHQLSSPCMKIELLNYRKREDGTPSSDLLFCPSGAAWDQTDLPPSKP